MNRTLVAGIVLTGLGLAGYATAIATAYPGRSLSVTTVMTGLMLVAIGRAVGGNGGEAPA